MDQSPIADSNSGTESESRAWCRKADTDHRLLYGVGKTHRRPGLAETRSG